MQRESACSLNGPETSALFREPSLEQDIIIGCRTDARVRSAVDSLLAERTGRGHPAVQLYYAHMSTTSYELDISTMPTP